MRNMCSNITYNCSDLDALPKDLTIQLLRVDLGTRKPRNFKALNSKIMERNIIDCMELAKLAGVIIRPHVLQILIQLLETNVSPAGIMAILQDICCKKDVAHSTEVERRNPKTSAKSADLNSNFRRFRQMPTRKEEHHGKK